MSEEVEVKEGAEANSAPQLSEKEISVAKMKYYGAQSGKGGFRKPKNEGSSHKGEQTKNDRIRIKHARQERVELYGKMELEELEAMIEENIVYEEADGKKNKLTGTYLEAFISMYQLKMNQKATAEAEAVRDEAVKEAKEKEGVPQLKATEPTEPSK